MSRASRCLPSAAAVLFALAAVIANLAPAQAASPLEKNFYLSGPNFDGDLPACEAALDRISGQFADTQAHFWDNHVAIVGYERVREVAYNPWALGSNPRRFCTAVALVNDARWPQVPYRKHVVRYSIGEDTGFAGFDWGVEWCVTGYDLNWAYNPRCKMAGP
ncbi:MAG TPA: hypothetical protein VN655_03040 [Pseudolabrys sp.]|jgi:hypothetical protein|nr:hypothetical protein [Pseudolabrys sp.]